MGTQCQYYHTLTDRSTLVLPFARISILGSVSQGRLNYYITVSVKCFLRKSFIQFINDGMITIMLCGCTVLCCVCIYKMMVECYKCNGVNEAK